MTSALLYAYVVNPLKALQLYGSRKPWWEAAIVLALLSLANCVQSEPWSVSDAFLISGLTFAGLAGVLILIAGVIDFSAQIMDLNAQSLKLFQWLALSLLPMALYLPLDLVIGAMPSAFGGLFQVSRIVITAGVVLLQINTIKLLYRVSIGRSVFLYCVPILVTVAVLAVVIVGFGLSLLMNLDF